MWIQVDSSNFCTGSKDEVFVDILAALLIARKFSNSAVAAHLYAIIAWESKTELAAVTIAGTTTRIAVILRLGALVVDRDVAELRQIRTHRLWQAIVSWQFARSEHTRQVAVHPVNVTAKYSNAHRIR
jgi:hypothetical protein